MTNVGTTTMEIPKTTVENDYFVEMSEKENVGRKSFFNFSVRKL